MQGLVEKGHPDRDGYDFHRHAEPVAPSEPAAFLRGGTSPEERRRRSITNSATKAETPRSRRIEETPIGSAPVLSRTNPNTT